MKDVNLLISNGVNVNESLELFGDMTLYDETLSDFLEGVNEKLDGLKKYKETADMPNYAILVHSLKSDARYLGFTKLAELAYQQEMESKANNIEYIYSNYDALIMEANRIIGIAKKYMGLTSTEDMTPSVVEEVKPVSPVVTANKTILVVDDSDIIRNFVNKIFSQNYQVLHARDGEEAINMLNNSQNVVAMLLDLNMPKVDGFAVLEYMEQNNLFVKIPVSIITGDDSKNTINRTFSYPIVDVLQKPFNERDVKAIVDRMLAFNQRF